MHENVAKTVIFNYPNVVDPKTYKIIEKIAPRIMDFLPLLKNKNKVAPYNDNITNVRKSYLSNIGESKLVNFDEVNYLARFLDTNIGIKMLTYFNNSVDNGLNYYNLSDKNFRKWIEAPFYQT